MTLYNHFLKGATCLSYNLSQNDVEYCERAQILIYINL